MKRTRRTEFARLREQLGFSIGEAARFLDTSERTAYRYERGESQPSKIAIRQLREREQQSYIPENVSTFRFVDLFAGIGGLRIGFESIGGKCVFTSEWDKYCRQTYSANFLIDNEHSFGGDIREFSENPDRIPKHDLLLAGFPCQPFSIAGVSKKNALGRPHGFRCDTQGTLFFDVAQIIDHHKPSVFVLENVKNLERHDGGRTFATIMHVLREDLGYQVYHRVISSEPWVPQRRERIFIVGFRDKSSFSFDDFKLPRRPWPTLGDILEPHDRVSEKYTLTPHLWKYLQDYKDKHTAKGNGFGYGLFGPHDVTRTLSARYYKDGSEVLVSQPSSRPRRLTPRECARLMGFDYKDTANFQIPVSDTQAYKQFGNAVVVPVVRAVAQLLKPHIDDALSRKHIDASPREPMLPFAVSSRKKAMRVNG
jgi:DNA (cytosine-5)-methyltransferase 1